MSAFDPLQYSAIRADAAYLLTQGTAIRVTLPADIDGFSRYRALSILNAS
jgi:hypothetical protein